MQALVAVVIPVFLVVGAGYLMVWSGIFGGRMMDELMRFAAQFAIPCLLFVGVARLDLARNFDLAMLAAFYGPAALCFFAGLLGARFAFGRDWEDAAVVGFACLFANSVMMGLPIAERAYGTAALANNIALVSVNATFCYLLGTTSIEIIRHRGRGTVELVRRVAQAMFRNALMIGVALGFVVNLSGLPLPGMLWDGLDMIVRAALPVALFALGGVLFRYRPEGDLRIIAFVCAVSLILHPALSMMSGRAVGLSDAQLRAAVLTAAMGPGVNAYIFATIYGRAMRVAASSVLVGTVLSILTVWVWLQLLP